MTATTCPACGRVHPSDCVRALGRFGDSPPLYRANLTLSPARRSREEAEADWCYYHAIKEES